MGSEKGSGDGVLFNEKFYDVHIRISVFYG